MHVYQAIVDKIDERIRERDKLARRAKKKKERNWETIYTAQILGLLDARSIVLTMESESDDKTDN